MYEGSQAGHHSLLRLGLLHLSLNNQIRGRGINRCPNIKWVIWLFHFVTAALLSFLSRYGDFSSLLLVLWHEEPEELRQQPYHIVQWDYCCVS